jgi:hypothetical protein
MVEKDALNEVEEEFVDLLSFIDLRDCLIPCFSKK